MSIATRRRCVAVAAAGAVLVAVGPASGAASNATPTKAHQACVTGKRGKRAVTICAVTGPRGPKGPPGPRGTTGPTGPRGFTAPAGRRGPTGRSGATGATGANGAVGIQGPAGSAGPAGPAGPAGGARAYALISPSATSPAIVASQSANFQSIRHVGLGTYCLTPAATVKPATSTAVVGGEGGLSASGVIPLAVLGGHPNACLATEFEVQTFNAGASGGTAPSDGAAFTIIVA